MASFSRASLTISSKKSRSTHVVVGLCGNEIRIIFGLREDVRNSSSQPAQERRRIRHRQHAGVAFRHHHAVLVDRIGGIRRNHRVVRPDGREQQVRQRILRADRHDRFALRIEVDVVVRLVARRDLSPQRGNPARLRIPVIARIARRLDQLVDDDARRCAVRVSHPEIDDIDLRRARLCPHLVDDGEHVRRQLLNTIVLFGIFGHYDYSTTAAAPSRQVAPPRRSASARSRRSRTG